MICSMTGFGRAQSSLEGLDLSVEINSVNRRNLEISISLPREWQSLERDIQGILRESFNRGKLHVTVQAAPGVAEAGFQWDPQGLGSSLQRLGKVAAEEGIEWPPSADALVRLAALNKVDVLLPEAGAARDTVLGQVRQSADDLLAMRKTEGSVLASDLAERLQALVASLCKIQELSEATVPRYREQLFQRLAQADLELDLDDERVLKEIAIFADKCDTSEEQTRLSSHFDQFQECLTEGSPIGRKLEFIVQEINREFNTIGSKANNIEVNRLVIDAKNEIERIREQIQNIE
jgi:uncharacterized protein (TIGR00255 family)